MLSGNDIVLAFTAVHNGLVPASAAEEALMSASVSETSLPEALAEKTGLGEDVLRALERVAAERLSKFGGDVVDAISGLSAGLDTELWLRQLGLGTPEGLDDTIDPHRDPREFPTQQLAADDTTDDSVISLEVPPKGSDRLRAAPPERYALKDELGRGGLGRVVLAVDNDFGRTVAIKQMHPDVAIPRAQERFLFEARAAGRLTHPNIVPVFEIGAFEDGGDQVPYFTMARIVGRDLHRITTGLKTGRKEFFVRFTRRRLLRIFQDVCLAMAFAHDHGILHRDLKPSNIMVGEYGEVFVVDWGLARFLHDPGEEDTAFAAFAVDDGSDDTQETLEGRILGTPMFMSPEQADGRLSELDHRSDIYALGAILYHLLTLSSPARGQNVYEVLDNVLQGSLVPIEEARENLHKRMRDEGLPVPKALAPVPEELAEICAIAMAHEKAARYDSARELADEIEMFLDGERERERNRLKAMEKVKRGRTLLQEREALKRRIRAAVEKAADAGRTVTPQSPPEEKRPLWDVQDEVEALQDDMARRLSGAEGAFHGALQFERDNTEARRALADLYWEKFLDAQETGERRDGIRFENLTAEYNDGHYDDLLAGRGLLSVTADAFGCDCLVEGRHVAVSEWDVTGYHPLSGRDLHRDLLEGVPRLEEGLGRAWKVHGPACATEPFQGARAWLYRFEERDRVLVPVHPGDWADGLEAGAPPEAVLDRLYPAGSPYRPGRGVDLGVTPVAPLALPIGSYLVILDGFGYEPVRAQVTVGRLDRQDLRVTMFPEGTVPAGYRQVHGGPYVSGGDRDNPYTHPKNTVHTDTAFVAEHPVTCAEYLAFLNDRDALTPVQARARTPRKAPQTGHYWPQDETGTVHLPTRAWLAEAPQGLAETASRLDMCGADWEARWPVLSVSWEDLTAYAAWQSVREGRLFCLTPTHLWEKAARGSDRRPFPWGDVLDPTFANHRASFADGMRPAVVFAFPFDESPFGVRGMAGNAREACLDLPQETPLRVRPVCGGAWPASDVLLRASGMGAFPPDFVTYYVGGRLAWIPRLPWSKEPGLNRPAE